MTGGGETIPPRIRRMLDERRRRPVELDDGCVAALWRSGRRSTQQPWSGSAPPASLCFNGAPACAADSARRLRRVRIPESRPSTRHRRGTGAAPARAKRQ